MRLFHTSNMEIREPDIVRGRNNADFGQGFYLTPDMDFACRWAGRDAIVNEYEFDESGLLIHRFARDEDWFRYIFADDRTGIHTDSDQNREGSPSASLYPIGKDHPNWCGAA